jgi:hypothetical protein
LLLAQQQKESENFTRQTWEAGGVASTIQEHQRDRKAPVSVSNSALEFCTGKGPDFRALGFRAKILISAQEEPHRTHGYTNSSEMMLAAVGALSVLPMMSVIMLSDDAE